MAHIGTFSEQNNGYTGTVRTLTLNVKVNIVPNDKESENARTFASLQTTLKSAQRGKRSARQTGLTCQ